MPRPDWSAPLARPIRLTDGKTFVTLKDAAAFVMKQPADDHQWQHAAGLLMKAAETGQTADVTKQIECVLWHRGQWVMPWR